MTRNLKALGLALFAFLAFGAMATASASAQTLGEIYLTGAGTNIHLQGEDVKATEGQSVPAFTANGVVVECTKATYTANAKVGDKALTVLPAYSNCWADAKHETTPVTVTMNGCDYNFNDLTTKEEGDLDNWKVQVDLECPAGKVVEVHRYSNAANHTSGTSNCTMTLAAANNQNLEGLTVYEETNPDALRLEDSVHPTAETHGACSFGFTLNIETTLHVSATVKSTEGEVGLKH